VFTQGATAQDASTANATQASTIIAAMQALLGGGANIKTINYSLSPVYNNPPSGQNPTIIGYSVSNTVEITLTDLSKIGRTIDTAIQSGANRVQGTPVRPAGPQPPTAQALRRRRPTRGPSRRDAAGLTFILARCSTPARGEHIDPVRSRGSGPDTSANGLVVIQASVTLRWRSRREPLGSSVHR
jgi:hypothetical protein